MIADYLIDQLIKVLQELVEFCRWIAGFTGAMMLLALAAFIYNALRDK